MEHRTSSSPSEKRHSRTGTHPAFTKSTLICRLRSLDARITHPLRSSRRCRARSSPTYKATSIFLVSAVDTFSEIRNLHAVRIRVAVSVAVGAGKGSSAATPVQESRVAASWM